jgi:hypothetical protein
MSLAAFPHPFLPIPCPQPDLGMFIMWKLTPSLTRMSCGVFFSTKMRKEAKQTTMLGFTIEDGDAAGNNNNNNRNNNNNFGQ